MTSRPRYERPSDIRAQNSLVKKYCSITDTFWKSHADLDRTDFSIYHDEQCTKLSHIIETKQRAATYLTYPSIVLSKHKVEHMLSLSVPAKFVVGFTDGMAWVTIQPHHLGTVMMGGRTKNTRDEADIELCAYIPIIEFSGYIEECGVKHWRKTQAEIEAIEAEEALWIPTYGGD